MVGALSHQDHRKSNPSNGQFVRSDSDSISPFAVSRMASSSGKGNSPVALTSPAALRPRGARGRRLYPSVTPSAPDTSGPYWTQTATSAGVGLFREAGRSCGSSLVNPNEMRARRAAARSPALSDRSCADS